MSSALNKAAVKLFSRHLEHYTPEDPLYEEYVDKRGRTKRRKVRPLYSTRHISSHLVPPSRSPPPHTRPFPDE